MLARTSPAERRPKRTSIAWLLTEVAGIPPFPGEYCVVKAGSRARSCVPALSGERMPSERFE